MKITAILLAAATAVAPLAASADQRGYAHRHVHQGYQQHQGYHQPRYQQPRYYQKRHAPRGYVRQESRRGATNAQVLGGLLALGLIANIYSNKKN